MPPRRHAVYWLPPPGELAARLASWLGWDPVAGAAVPHPAPEGLPGPARAITERPRRYGPHATLRPPMRLRDGVGEAEACTALTTLAGRLAPARAAGLEVATMGAFVALRPAGDASALADLAAAVVEGTEPLRRPSDEAELARRRASGLTERQDGLLLRWGYPYVMEEFRFHLTLSGPLEPEARDAVRDALAAWLGPFLPAPFEASEIALLEEGHDGFFRELRRFPLRG